MRLLHSLMCLSLLGLMLTAKFVQCEDLADDSTDGIVEEEEDSDAPREKPHYIKPQPKGNYYFAEPFDNEVETLKRWVNSQAKKDGVEEDLAKYDGKWSVEEAKENPLIGDLGLVLTSRAKHHAISAKLDKPFEFKEKPLVVQYEVRFQNGIDCGGAYVKLLSKQSKSMDLKAFHDKTPYTIMFGPDKCGLDNKLHFIFRHQNPKTGEFEEKHAKKPTATIDSFFSDKKTHLYTLIVNPDNTFEFLVDNAVVNQGNLLEDVSPPVNPPKEIEDPDDRKPSDWDDKEKISDPDATKPDDWDESESEFIPDSSAVQPDGWLEDEPLLVPDPAADKPEDWDDDMDGEWEAPLVDNPNCKEAPGCGEWKPETIKNPLYKGKWSPAMIDNPNYKGIWKPQIIANPNYFEDLHPFKMTSIDAVGLELWSMTDGILFDNFLLTDDRGIAEHYAEQTWVRKNIEEKASSSSGHGIVDSIKKMTNERPWLWAVFIVVIVLPLVLVIAYCCVSKGLWNTIKTAADERPWLWAVYVVVLLLPVVLLSICLCPKSGPVKPEDIDAHRKKTDEATPDDEEKEDDKSDDKADEAVSAGGDAKAKPKSSKSDLNAAAKEADADDAGDDADEDDEEETKASTRKSPRRRARKE